MDNKKLSSRPVRQAARRAGVQSPRSSDQSLNYKHRIHQRLHDRGMVLRMYTVDGLRGAFLPGCMKRSADRRGADRRGYDAAVRVQTEASLSIGEIAGVAVGNCRVALSHV